MRMSVSCIQFDTFQFAQKTILYIKLRAKVLRVQRIRGQDITIFKTNEMLFLYLTVIYDQPKNFCHNIYFHIFPNNMQVRYVCYSLYVKFQLSSTLYAFPFISRIHVLRHERQYFFNTNILYFIYLFFKNPFHNIC